MKHAVGASVMLIVLLLTCLMFMKIVEKSATETYVLVNQAYEVTDRHTAMLLIKKAEQQWHTKERLLGAVLRHDEFDDVGDSLAMLKAYVMQDEWDEFYGTCAKLLATLSHIKDKDLPLLKNIM